MKKGFTLIELLVVISIISLLSSIVIASLNSAREKAEISKFIQEMDQVQNALELYRAKFGEYPDNSLSQSVLLDMVAENLVSNNFLAQNIELPNFIQDGTGVNSPSYFRKGGRTFDESAFCGNINVKDNNDNLSVDYMIRFVSNVDLPYYRWSYNESLVNDAYCIIP